MRPSSRWLWAIPVLVFSLRASAEALCAETLQLAPLTRGFLREANTANLKARAQEHPVPEFSSLAREVLFEQVGFSGPNAFHALRGENSFVSAPAPAATMDTAVNMHEEGKSIPLHVDQEWGGHRTSTTVFASLPKTLRPNPNGFLVGREYPAVVVHLHGGNTVTASGKNAMSIGQALAGDSIPVLGIDLPGHAQATRQLEGLTTMQGQVDWLLKLMDRLIDPKVKIIVSGHSWGAEFVVFMQRHSHEPKYKRISAFFAAAPPVDVSLGGDEEEKARVEQHFEQNFADYKTRIAPSDYEFLSNILRHGKVSPVGSFFTAFTELDYHTPPLTLEQQEGQAKLVVVVGEADGLVYVGREKYFQTVFGNLPKHSKFILLGPGRVWKSKTPDDFYPTGHNVWDFLDQNGKPVVYRMIADLVHEFAPSDSGGEAADEVVIKLNEFYRNYANFFLFRELVERHEEFIRVATPERAALETQLKATDRFLNQLQEIENKSKAGLKAKLAVALQELRQRLGMSDQGSVEQARAELAYPPMTPARQAQLSAYVAQVEAIENEIGPGFNDEEYARDLAALTAEYGPVLERRGIENVTQYFPAFETLVKTPKGALSKDDERDRGALSRLQQAFVEITRRKNARMDKLRLERIAQVQRPDGDLDSRMARRQLLADRSDPERASKLQRFIDEAPIVEAHVTELEAQAVAAQSATLIRPEGIASVEEARALKLKLNALQDFTYAPPGDPHIARLAAEVRALVQQRQEVRKGTDSARGLSQLTAALQLAEKQRSSLLNAWEEFSSFTSPRLREIAKLTEEKYQHAYELYYDYEYANRAWLRELKRTGTLTAANILLSRPDLEMKRIAFRAAYEEYAALRDAREKNLRLEALAQSLDGAPPEKVAKAHELAQKLWGPQGAIASSRTLEDELETLRREESLLEQRLLHKQWEYIQAMEAKGEKLPYRFERFNIRALLELPYETLIARLRTEPTMLEAFRNTINIGTEYNASLRKEAQSKDSGNY